MLAEYILHMCTGYFPAVHSLLLAHNALLVRGEFLLDCGKYSLLQHL